jgi:hypothetical protein
VVSSAGVSRLGIKKEGKRPGYQGEREWRFLQSLYSMKQLRNEKEHRGRKTR